MPQITLNYLERNLVDNKYDFFISYSRDIYEDIVEPIIDFLDNLGFLIWIDKTEVSLGTDIYANLLAILNKVPHWQSAIVFIDSSYVNKEWCNIEFDFLMQNKVNCYPILYKLNKENLNGKFTALKQYNLATIRSQKDINITIDKILMAYLKNLKIDKNMKISIQTSPLLYSMINYYRAINLTFEEKVILAEIICKIIFNSNSDDLLNIHYIKVIRSIINYKVEQLYTRGECSRYDYIITCRAIDCLLNNFNL